MSKKNGRDKELFNIIKELEKSNLDMKKMMQFEQKLKAIMIAELKEHEKFFKEHERWMRDHEVRLRHHYDDICRLKEK